jgi:hypothetical protein
VAVGRGTGAVLVAEGFEGLGTVGREVVGLAVAVGLGTGFCVVLGGGEAGSGRFGGSDVGGALGGGGSVVLGAVVGGVSLSGVAVGSASLGGASVSREGSEVGLTLVGGLARDTFGAAIDLAFLGGAATDLAFCGGAATDRAFLGGSATFSGWTSVSGGGSRGGVTTLSEGALRTGGEESSRARSRAAGAGGTDPPSSVSAGSVSTDGGSTSCDIGGTAAMPGSAMAAHGWAMIAPVVAETAASRSPETSVTRRGELRGGIGGSSWIRIYGVGAGPERGFQPAAVNSGVPGRATCGTVAERGSGTLTQSPRLAPRMSGFQVMSRLMAYGLE